MKLEIIGKNYDVGTKLKGIIEKKVERLGKYFDDNSNCKVVCKKDNKLYKLELTITSAGAFYRAEVAGENMYENIDVALPKIEKQIVKRNKKRTDYYRQPGIEPAFVFLEEEPDEYEPLIKRKKSFALDPITEEDAIVMLESIDHDFYVFLNSETGNVNIVYKRKDGDLGLIEVTK